MRRWFSMFFICLFIFTACGHKRSEEAIAAFEKMLAEDDGRTYVATFEKQNLRDYISVVGTRLLYMDFNQYEANFYIYDFQAETTEKIKTVSNVALKGGEDVVIDNICYFYLAVSHFGDLKNVLYAVDFSTNEMYSVSDNMYSAKMIPLISVEEQVVALQGNKLSNGNVDTFLEILHENGDTTRIDLTQNDVGIPENQDKGPYILYVDSDDENIYALEKTGIGAEARYYLTRYASDYSCTFAQEITSIFAEYEITTAIGKFYAFGDYFYIRDFSNNAILCKCEDNSIQMIYCERGLYYVVNFDSNEPYQYFSTRMNDIYRLNVETGSFEKKSYDFENERLEIYNIMAYNKRLLIVEEIKTDRTLEEKVYLVTCKE